MKKTLIALLSILLIAFAFTACDNGNKGPAGPTEEEQTAANDLATTYMGTLQYGDLIDKAINKKDPALTFSSDSKTSLTIEFKDYKVSGTGDNTVDSIKSGAIKFDFTETAPAATAKTVMKGYSVSTIEDKPLVFVHKDKTENRLTFTVEGENCSIDLVTDSTKITGITKDTLVEFSKPTDATIKVNDIEVTYEDIAEDVGGQGSVDPFTQSEAAKVVSQIVNGLDKAEILNDVIKGLTGDEKDDVPGVTLNSIEGKYKGEKLSDQALAGFLAKFFTKSSDNQDSATKTAETETATLPEDLNDLRRNITDLSITVDVSFGSPEPYENAFKANSGVTSIDSGTMTVVLYPGKMDLSEGEDSIAKLNGIYKITASNMKVTMDDKTTYTLGISGLDSLFELVPGGSSVINVPAEDDSTTSITITKASLPTKTVAWSSLTLDDQTGFAPNGTTAKQTDAEYFYQHFGTKNFLNDLYVDMNDATLTGVNADNNGLEITNLNDLKVVEIATAEEPKANEAEDTGATHQLVLKLKLDGYRYYIAGSNQRAASNEITLTFLGTLNNEANKFTATKFTAEGTLTLSDAAKVRPTVTNVKVNVTDGSIGDDTASDGGSGTRGIEFTVSSDAEKKVTITSYNASYAQKLHEFVFTMPEFTV